MNTKTVINLIFIIGLVVVVWWLLKLALNFFIPLLVVGAGIFVWYKYFRKEA